MIRTRWPAVVVGLTFALGAQVLVAAPPAFPKDARQAKWLTSFTNATGQARKEDKLIVAYFRGSDWDDYCKKLDRDVLNTELFVNWAEKNVVLLDVDFPADKRQSPSQKKHNDA